MSYSFVMERGVHAGKRKVPAVPCITFRCNLCNETLAMHNFLEAEKRDRYLESLNPFQWMQKLQRDTMHVIARAFSFPANTPCSISKTFYVIQVLLQSLQWNTMQVTARTKLSAKFSLLNFPGSTPFSLFEQWWVIQFSLTSIIFQGNGSKCSFKLS